MKIQQKTFYKRVKERCFWAKYGWWLLVSGGTLFCVAMGIFFSGLSFSIFYMLVNVSLLVILLGGIFTLFFSRVGWSKFKLVDFFLNRFSMYLMITGLLVGMISTTVFEPIIPSALAYGQWLLITGTVLFLLGMYFQSSEEVI